MPALSVENELIQAGKIAYALEKHNGNSAKAARELGIVPSTIHKAKQRPIIKSALQQLAEYNLKKAGAGKSKVYKRIAQGLDAEKVIDIKNGDVIKDVDFKERRETAKLCLQLTGDLEEKSEVSVNTVVIDRQTSDAILEQIRNVTKAPAVIDVT